MFMNSVDNRILLSPILNQLNTVQIFKEYLIKIQFNITLIYPEGYKRSLHFKLSSENAACTSL
jgi:hypothetical protein